MQTVTLTPVALTAGYNTLTVSASLKNNHPTTNILQSNNGYDNFLLKVSYLF